MNDVHILYFLYYWGQNHLIRLNHTNVPAEMAAERSTMSRNA